MAAQQQLAKQNMTGSKDTSGGSNWDILRGAYYCSDKEPDQSSLQTVLDIAVPYSRRQVQSLAGIMYCVSIPHVHW